MVGRLGVNVVAGKEIATCDARDSVMDMHDATIWEKNGQNEIESVVNEESALVLA